MSPERLILFDIDGTLLSAGEAPRRAFRHALVEHFGTEGPAAATDFTGKTDPEIVHELMGAAGFEEGEIAGRIAALFDHYLEGLERELERGTGHHLYPGVQELVPALTANPSVALGLVTGNVERGARIKLGHFGLWHHFSIGAFGSDDRNRDGLVPIAVERAERTTGRRFSGHEVVVVGDTPADVRCARAAGAMAIAVATGTPSRKQLAACGPDLLLESLSDWRAVLAQLVGVATTAPG